MIPRTRELLTHVRQLSQLVVDDPGARARVRRAKRLLKVGPSLLLKLESKVHCRRFLAVHTS